MVQTKCSTLQAELLQPARPDFCDEPTLRSISCTDPALASSASTLRLSALLTTAWTLLVLLSRPASAHSPLIPL